MLKNMSLHWSRVVWKAQLQLNLTADCTSQDASQEISVQDFEEVEGFSEDRSNVRVTELPLSALLVSTCFITFRPFECEDCEDYCENFFREFLSSASAG